MKVFSEQYKDGVLMSGYVTHQFYLVT